MSRYKRKSVSALAPDLIRIEIGVIALASTGRQKTRLTKQAEPVEWRAMTTTTRASLEEVREFANKVREAGGGNPLDALMPAVPSDASQCLIAKNLNFNCVVNNPDGGNGPWMMHVDDEKIARSIAEALELELIYDEGCGSPYDDPAWGLVLPDEIGQVANDFDKAFSIALALTDGFSMWPDIDEETRGEYDDDVVLYSKEVFGSDVEVDFGGEFDIDLVKEMWPYIEESVKEAKAIGIFNENGELIL